MLASDFSDGSSVETQTYRKGHAHRPMESTTCSRVIAAFIPGRGRAPSRHVFVISGRLVGRSLQRFRRPRSAENGDLCGAARALRGCITIVLDPADFLPRLGT